MARRGARAAAVPARYSRRAAGIRRVISARSRARSRAPKSSARAAAPTAQRGSPGRRSGVGGPETATIPVPVTLSAAVAASLTFTGTAVYSAPPAPPDRHRLLPAGMSPT